ncbi:MULTISPECIES: alpha/beta hydrolase [unclassified Leptolyngbya]|uniref:alpha/beta fold hydrolase n=1 Tax=unclassified Leptolyngbya TaxID=2650499 RepID=UPI001683F5D9|nr:MULTISPECIES: alpha/beta hydrolase [unclassified Leptolyngbya]MBD1909404.1 alpha/beta hydrolase [Leptolyngbya sp. FACHB-8]MBD2157121.1 alpha/beta hydrolase [Leptolyngbya sp. FACHB-16]
MMGDRLTKKQLDLPSYRTLYLEGGDASGSAPILFLHGWGMTTAPYRRSLNLLCQHYRVIAPDLPGFGKAKYPQYLTHHLSYVEPLISLLDALSLSKVHLVGHSGGGAVAIALAATHPSRVSSLVLTDSTGIPLGSFPKVLLLRVRELLLEIPKIKPIPLLKFVYALLYNGVFNTGNVLKAAQLALQRDLRPLLPQVQAPTLVLWGGGDRFIPLQMAYEFAEHIPHAKSIIVEGEYHEWAMLRPEKFVPLVLSFLDEVEGIKDSSSDRGASLI